MVRKNKLVLVGKATVTGAGWEGQNKVKCTENCSVVSHHHHKIACEGMGFGAAQPDLKCQCQGYGQDSDPILSTRAVSGHHR